MGQRVMWHPDKSALMPYIRGDVVLIIPPEVQPRDVPGWDALSKTVRSMRLAGRSRNNATRPCESYLVLLDARRPRLRWFMGQYHEVQHRRRLLWPIPAWLRPDDGSLI